MTTKVKVTGEGLLIPREVTDRVLANSEEVEIFEEPGRLLISPVEAPVDQAQEGRDKAFGEEDPILLMGEDPVEDEATDASENHDRYLYTGG